MKKQHVQLTPADREILESLIRKAQQSAKTYRRALALLELDRSQTYTAVSKTLQGRPIQISGEQRAKVTALACSEPPEGYACWSLRLLADRAVELGYCEHLFHTEVADILKK